MDDAIEKLGLGWFQARLALLAGLIYVIKVHVRIE